MSQICKVNLFGYDYSGYGSASGSPSEKNTYGDIEAVYDYLISHNIVKNPEKEVVLYGQSVGSGPSCKLAVTKSRPIRGMILHSPILSGIRVLVQNRGPLCCCDIYPNINRIKKVTAPVLVIHGEHDQEVHFSHGENLHRNIPAPFQNEPCWIKDAGHNDIVENHPVEFFPAVSRFLRSLEPPDICESVVLV